MKISFDDVKKLLDKIEHLKFENSNNDDYWKYVSISKDVSWNTYFARICGNEYVELERNLCDRLSKLGVINNE